MNELAQAIAAARKVLQIKPEDPAVLIVHPSTLARIEHAQATDTPDITQTLSQLGSLTIETDPEVEPDLVYVVPQSQLDAYRRARRWAEPRQAAHAAAALEEFHHRNPSQRSGR